jgi:hypothetical protein
MMPIQNAVARNQQHSQSKIHSSYIPLGGMEWQEYFTAGSLIYHPFTIR